MRQKTLKVLEPYADEHGNAIIVENPATLGYPTCRVTFKGHGNTLYIRDGAKLVSPLVEFAGNGAYCEIGGSRSNAASHWSIRLGTRGRAIIADNIETDGVCRARVGSESTLRLESGCSFGKNCELQAGELVVFGSERPRAAAITDCSIVLGANTILEDQVLICEGVHIGQGSHILQRSVVRSSFPDASTIGGNTAVLMTT